MRLNEEEAVCNVHKKCTVEGRRICDINRELAFCLICNFVTEDDVDYVMDGWLDTGWRTCCRFPLQ